MPILIAPAATRRASALASVTAAAFCLILLPQAAWVRHTTSITFDETFYLTCALQTVHDRRLDPRLAEAGVAPLPVLLSYVAPLAATGGRDRPTARGEVGDRDLINAPRTANTIVCGVSLVLLVFGWLYRRRGPTAAAMGAGLIALSPTIVAHASLATTDIAFALFGTAAVATLGWYLRHPKNGRLGILAVIVSAAMAAKYTGVLLLAVVAVAVLVVEPLCPGPVRIAGSLLRSLAKFLAFTTVVMFLWWGFHLFSFTGPLTFRTIEQTPDSSPWIRVLGRGPAATWLIDVAGPRLRRPAPLQGVWMQYVHNQKGHDAFLNGRRSMAGWWYYFPLAFAYKSTPAELILACGLALAGFMSLRSPVARLRALDPELRSVLVFVAATVFACVVLSQLGIGQRYLLVLYPLLVVVGVDRLFVRLAHRPRWAAAAALVLLTMQAVSNAAIAPHFLAYFNALSGGPARAWTRLVDSNLDWGQDLPALRDALASRQSRGPVALSYFGTAVPEAYGIAAHRVDELRHGIDQYTTLAISATHLQGVYLLGRDPFERFRDIPADARAGYSIFVYELDTPDKRDAFRQAIRKLRLGF